MTAVEWIISKLPMVNDKEPYLAELIEQAKEMERQQIIDAHGIKMKGVNNHKCVDGEQYYNETFKKK